MLFVTKDEILIIYLDIYVSLNNFTIVSLFYQSKLNSIENTFEYQKYIKTNAEILL